MRIGLGELILVLIVALVILGPDKLPQYMKMLGNGIRELKKSTSGLNETLEKEVVKPLNEAAKPLRDAVEPINETVSDLQKSIKKADTAIRHPEKAMKMAMDEASEREKEREKEAEAVDPQNVDRKDSANGGEAVETA